MYPNVVLYGNPVPLLLLCNHQFPANMTSMSKAQKKLCQKKTNLFLTKQNIPSIIHNVPSWFFICQISYFARKYRPTVSALSSVHVCAPHNFHEKWDTHMHVHAHARAHTPCHCQWYPYSYIFILFKYLFN